MRILGCIAILLTLSACASSSLERQAGSTAKGDCRDQADAYIRANYASIPSEWREFEKYKHYQQCLMDQRSKS
ncbi:MAG: hypothetical protein MAG794_01017 [Gammaproteobacteria bacterium]|nr:hypothetical protein [Gammaproteobacteria bacterium]